MTDAKDLYLDLMKRSLAGLLWNQKELFEPIDMTLPRSIDKGWALNFLAKYLARTGKRIMRPVAFDLETRLKGGDWPPPPFAYTMIGMRRLDNLQTCIEDVIENNVPGDLIETGVWRGGATIFMRAVLKAYGITERCVWAADSFEGLPAPNPVKYPADEHDTFYQVEAFKVSLEEVQANFARYALLDEQVRFLKGWFKDTLPDAPIRKFAILRLDGDMYESTMDALTCLCPKLSVGGYVIIDDYCLKGCREAVHDFRSQHGINDPIKVVDDAAVYWQATKAYGSGFGNTF